MTVIRRNQASLTQLDAARLATAQATAVAEINGWAARERARYITVMPGQEMIYMAKEVEARGYLADGAPILAAYPLLSAEVGIPAPDAYQLAQLWVNVAALWRDVASRIEGVRLRHIDAVMTAPDLTAVQASRDVWAHAAHT